MKAVTASAASVTSILRDMRKVDFSRSRLNLASSRRSLAAAPGARCGVRQPDLSKSTAVSTRLSPQAAAPLPSETSIRSGHCPRARKGWTGGAGEPSAVPAARVRWSHPPQATGERIGAGRSSR